MADGGIPTAPGGDKAYPGNLTLYVTVTCIVAAMGGLIFGISARFFKQCFGSNGSGKLLLETLPQDILIRILCGVDHDDLKSLIHVSRQLRQAAVIAKNWHFAYNTPKKIPAFRTPLVLVESSSEFDEIEAPNAPKQSRFPRSRLTQKKLTAIDLHGLE